MSTTRTGARLGSHHRGWTMRLAQMSDADYKQPKCAECDAPIHDDRLEHGGPITTYCSRYCRDRAKRKQTGRIRLHGTLSGRETVWKQAYEAAKAAHGAEIQIECADRQQARQRADSFNQRRDYEARSKDCVVYLRFVSAGARP